MIHPRLIVVLATLVLVSACGPMRVRTPGRAAQDVVVLLPDEGGTVGEATVSNSAGAVSLFGARESTMIGMNKAPTAVTRMSEADVQRLFGDVLSALPLSPRHFTLFFKFQSEELTDGSRALVQEVLKAVKSRQVPDVTVLGHTDTTGTSTTNFALGLRRANRVRAILVETGLNPSSIDVVSHGEAELLIPTSDGVFEPRNRRVEITVR